MSSTLAVVRLLLLGATAISVVRLEAKPQARNRALACAFGIVCLLSIFTIALVDNDVASLGRATSAALILGTLPLAARMLHPTGIDLLDPAASAFVGFVVGSLSWGLAWRATLGAAALAGLLAVVELVRNDDTNKRIPFVSILLGVALLSTTGAALVG